MIFPNHVCAHRTLSRHSILAGYWGILIPYALDLTAVKFGRCLRSRARPGTPGQALVAALAERSSRHTGTAMRCSAGGLRVFWRSPGPASSTNRIPAPASRPSGDDPSRKHPAQGGIQRPMTTLIEGCRVEADDRAVRAPEPTHPRSNCPRSLRSMRGYHRSPEHRRRSWPGCCRSPEPVVRSCLRQAEGKTFPVRPSPDRSPAC